MELSVPLATLNRKEHIDAISSTANTTTQAYALIKMSQHLLDLSTELKQLIDKFKI